MSIVIGKAPVAASFLIGCPWGHRPPPGGVGRHVL